MPNRCNDLLSEGLYECAADGPPLRTLPDAADVVGEALARGARVVVLPVSRLDPAFFQLRNGMAGEMLQKFINDRLCVAIVGDFAAFTAESPALRDLIRESNRGNEIWFLADRGEVKKRLAESQNC
jgi:hypothetical protein